MIPSDPFMLLSFINMKLRDEFDDFDSLCDSLELDPEEIKKKLSDIGYQYNAQINQFK